MSDFRKITRFKREYPSALQGGGPLQREFRRLFNEYVDLDHRINQLEALIEKEKKTLNTPVPGVGKRYSKSKRKGGNGS